MERGKCPERIVLEGLRGRVKRAAYLGDGVLNIAEEKGVWVVYPVANGSVDSPVDVICVELEEGYEILPLHAWVAGRMLTWENAVPVNAYSSMDYYTGFRSVIAYNWMIKTAVRQLKPVLFYTEEERGKKIVLAVDGEEKEVVLDGGSQVKTQAPRVMWGNIFGNVRRFAGKHTGSFCGRWSSGRRGVAIVWGFATGAEMGASGWREALCLVLAGNGCGPGRGCGC